MGDPQPPDTLVASPSDARTRAFGDPVSRLWHVTMPRVLDRVSTTLADQMADGAWLAAIPGLAAVVPILAFLFGFYVPHSFPAREIELVYTESMLFMIAAIAISFLSGTAGIALWLGYLVADILGPMIDTPASWENDRRIGLIAGLLVTDLLLSVLVIVVPNLARRMAEEVDLPFRSDAAGDRALLRTRTALAAGSAAVLAFLWAQATIVLIRPPWVWAQHSPRTESVSNVQDGWPLLVAVAVIAATARMLLEQAIALRPVLAARVHVLLDARWASPRSRARSISPVGIAGRSVVMALLITALLAGMYEDVLDAAIIFVAAVATALWRSGAFVRGPRQYVEAMRHIPSVLRLVVAVGIAFLVGEAVFGGLYRDGSFRSVLFGAVLTLVLMAVLFPGAAPETAPRPAAPIEPAPGPREAGAEAAT